MKGGRFKIVSTREGFIDFSLKGKCSSEEKAGRAFKHTEKRLSLTLFLPVCEREAASQGVSPAHSGNLFS